MRSSPPIDRVVAALKRLPGIGEKSATRLAFFILGAPDALVGQVHLLFSYLYGVTRNTATKPGKFCVPTSRSIANDNLCFTCKTNLYG